MEASELLELFQWKSSNEVKQDKMPELKEELADVLIYSYMMADNLKIDVDQIIDEKIKKDEKKYPIKLSKSKNLKYTEFK